MDAIHPGLRYAWMGHYLLDAKEAKGEAEEGTGELGPDEFTALVMAKRQEANGDQ